LMPIVQLQDGMTFAFLRVRREAGLEVDPYHRIRVWGSAGYIIPSFVLYVLMRLKWPIAVILPAAMGFAVLGAVNAFGLPRLPTFKGDHSKLPTVAAASALWRPPLRVYCFAMFILTLSTMGFYTFYPIYLTQRIGMRAIWLGPISTVGVIVEIICMLGFGKLVALFGLKGVLIAGVVAMVVRFVLLWQFPNPYVAVGTQLLHGLMTLVTVLTPPMFLDRHADSHFRNSMQGVYAMVVSGIPRVLGNLLAGPIARRTLTGVFACSAILCVIAAVLILIAFYEEAAEEAQAPVEAKAA